MDALQHHTHRTTVGGGKKAWKVRRAEPEFLAGVSSTNKPLAAGRLNIDGTWGRTTGWEREERGYEEHISTSG